MGWSVEVVIVMGPVSFRDRGVEGAEESSPDAADVFDSVDCCEASSSPATPSGPVVTRFVTGEAAEGG